MDIDGLVNLLQQIESGSIECIARDLPEPSPFAHEILNAKPYAFLDNAPLEERRTQAVYTRRASESSGDNGLGILDAAAIEKVCAEAWPRATIADELHETLLLVGVMDDEEIGQLAGGENGSAWLDSLKHERRAGRLSSPNPFWVAAERLPMLQSIYAGSSVEPALVAPETEKERVWERSDAMRELVRGRMEIIGPLTAGTLANFFRLSLSEIEGALLALEAEGFVLRGKFHPDARETEWCDRRLLARIHRLTINRLRAEIQPVSIAEFQRFLLAWQRVDEEHRVEGPDGVRAIVESLDGYGVPAAAWEPEILSLRVKDYTPAWLDQLCFTGRIGWGRLAPPRNADGRSILPIRSSPISLFTRENAAHWCTLSGPAEPFGFSPDTQLTLETLASKGALFFGELVKQTRLLPSRVERALAELVAQGYVTADSFEGMRALLVPEEKRAPFSATEHRRRHKAVTSIEFAGRWSLLRPLTSPGAHEDQSHRDEAIVVFARQLLRRYGLVFRRMIERETLSLTWYELCRTYRRLEAQGEIRGGYFVNGVSGEQFALPEAVGLLRSIRKKPLTGTLRAISAADPLNLAGILTPGSRIAAISAHRILLRDGVPVAALKAGQVIPMETETPENEQIVARALRIGSLSAALRPYYG
jgi:ATP-dependent Lhr-like helicase